MRYASGLGRDPLNERESTDSIVQRCIALHDSFGMHLFFLSRHSDILFIFLYSMLMLRLEREESGLEPFNDGWMDGFCHLVCLELLMCVHLLFGYVCSGISLCV